MSSPALKHQPQQVKTKSSYLWETKREKNNSKIHSQMHHNFTNNYEGFTSN